MDLEHDLFRVYGPATRDEIHAAIRRLHYEPSDGDGSAFHPSNVAVPVGEPPPFVREALARASREKKQFVLVDCLGSVGSFSGPDGAARSHRGGYVAGS